MTKLLTLMIVLATMFASCSSNPTPTYSAPAPTYEPPARYQDDDDDDDWDDDDDDHDFHKKNKHKVNHSTHYSNGHSAYPATRVKPNQPKRPDTYRSSGYYSGSSAATKPSSGYSSSSPTPTRSTSRPISRGGFGSSKKRK